MMKNPTFRDYVHVNTKSRKFWNISKKDGTRQSSKQIKIVNACCNALNLYLVGSHTLL